MNNKVTLFLGAGFSFGAHQPIMSRFGEFSRSQLWGADKNSPVGKFSGIANFKGNKKSYPVLKESGEIYEALRNKCKDEKRLDTFNPDNMEDLFTYAEVREQCDYGDLSLNRQDIETCESYPDNISNKDLIIQIRLWLWQIFRRVPLNKPERWTYDGNPIDPKPYKIFMKNLQEKGFDSTYLITTNYDLIVEYLCNYFGENKIYYPIKSFKSIHINYKTQGNFLYDDNNALPLHYCKLHGSVNYYEPFDNSSLVRINTDLGGYINQSQNVPTFPSASSLDMLDELNEFSLSPGIIPPSYAKLTNRPWLREIWNAALDYLINSDKWMFIGYSFPLSDGHMRSLINLALMERSSSPQIVLVSPNPYDLMNYKPLINENFKFYHNSFSSFVGNGYFERELNSLI